MCSIYPNTKACAIEALTTRLVCCLLLAGAVLPTISPITAHNTTAFVNHTPTILYWETDLYMQKFWPETPNLWQIQVCFPAGLFKNSREKWRKWISLTGSPCWPSASANHRQTG